MKKTLIVLFISIYGFAFAQVQLTDHASSIHSSGSNPFKFTIFDNSLFFTASNGSMGFEIFKSDGTSAGTSLIRDVNLGTGGSVSSNILEFKNKLYYVGSDGINGSTLWVTDGSSNGTYRITDNMSLLNELVHDGNFIYFLTRPTIHTMEVWKSDGTHEGTTLVKGGISWISGGNLTSALGLVFFSVQSYDTHEIMVWRTDGTEAGTFAIVEQPANPSHFIEYNGSLYFVGGPFPDPNSVGIMKTDGTVEGTETVVAIHSATQRADFADVIVHNNKMYFSFFDYYSHRFFIWESQGEEENTTKIYDHTGAGYFAPSVLCGTGEHLFFTSGNDASGTSLIKLDLTTLEPESVKEILPARESPLYGFSLEFDVNIILAAGPDRIFVRSNTESLSYADLWVSDGTAEGTNWLSRILYYFPNMIVFQDQLFYCGAEEFNFELWKSDGTASGTGLVKDINTSAAGMSFFYLPVAVNERAVFSAAHPDKGTEFWVTDGTVANTTFKDLQPGAGASIPRDFIALNNKVFFSAVVESSNSQIFSSDGTVSGTEMVTDFPNGTNLTPWLVGDGEDKLFIAGKHSDVTTSLRRLNATSGEVNEIKNFGKDLNNVAYRINGMAVANKVLYFILSSTSNELWKSNGTTEGTIKVADIRPSGGLYSAGGFIFFVAYNGPGFDEQELYKSDGTETGTGIVKNLNGSAGAGIESLFSFHDKMLFTATEEGTGKELWVTDGTPENTLLLKDIHEGSGDGIYFTSFALLGNSVLFTASDKEHGAELWKTDGTPAGTVLVKDIVPGEENSKPLNLAATSDGVYFSAYTPDHGYEIWRSDGTAEGTELKLDLVPGPGYSDPRGFVHNGTNLIFLATTPSTGLQAWSYHEEEEITSTIEDANKLVNVYPNPSAGVYKIETEKLQGGSVAIYSSQGYCVGIKNLTASTEINLRNLPSGLYVMRFRKGIEMVTLKVVKL